MAKQVEIIVVGAGARGRLYADYVLQHPELAKIVGVAEPDDYHRDMIAKRHDISPDKVFKDWREVEKCEKFADAVIISTQDAMHLEPAEVFADKKYHILLEKPMAPSEQDCRKVVKTAIENNIIFAVCHVMRYTKYTRKLKQLLDSGLIGDIISIQHLEPVGYWHFAHSFVRGNWRNQSESSFMLLAKSCHDIDWIRYIVGSKCVCVSSFGNLKHFVKENKPLHAGYRCLDCAVESQCPYSAKKIYLKQAAKNDFDGPVNVITKDFTFAGAEKALKEGPYGRCVYQCDNNVVDHQVVNMLFDNGSTATFTMTAFDEFKGRLTRIFGTKGRLYGDGSVIEHVDFLKDSSEKIETKDPEGEKASLAGHGGGDYRLMENFVEAVANNDPNRILSGPEETLETHLIVFAAEKARLTNTVVEIG